MCDPPEGGSGRGLTKLLEVVQHIWRCEKVEELWLVGKLRLLPKSGDLGNPNDWRHYFAGRDCEVVLLGALKSHDVAHAGDGARSAARVHAGQEHC